MGAEQLLSAAGHGDAAVHEAVDAIVRAAEASVEATRGPREGEPPAIEAAPAEESEEEAEAEPAEPTAEETGESAETPEASSEDEGPKPT
jgi:hypothetical protein